MSNWNNIWKNRETDSSIENISLKELMLLNGYDSATGGVSEQNWRTWLDYHAEKHDIKNSTSVFEVGCGAGAFLYPLFERGATVGGIDLSPPLIEIARKAFASSDFHAAEAIDINTSPQYDVVISMGVFLYFPNLDYAASVFKKMVEKARHSISILDVPDKSHQKATEAKRRELVGEKIYEEKYSGLQHLYYDKAWFIEQAKQLNATIETYDQNLAGYNNANGRFNVFIKK